MKFCFFALSRVLVATPWTRYALSSHRMFKWVPLILQATHAARYNLLECVILNAKKLNLIWNSTITFAASPLHSFLRLSHAIHTIESGVAWVYARTLLPLLRPIHITFFLYIDIVVVVVVIVVVRSGQRCRCLYISSSVSVFVSNRNRVHVAS